MGSINVLTLNGYPMGENKGPPLNEWLSLFTRKEFQTARRARSSRNPLIWGKSTAADAGRREMTYEFRAPAQTVLSRLELLGFTRAAVAADYRLGHAMQMKEHRALGYPYELRGVRVDRALKIAANLIRRKVMRWNTKKITRLGPVEAFMLGDHENLPDFGLPFSDWRFLIRGLISHLPPQAEVVLDLTDQVQGGWTTAKDCLARVDAAARGKRIIVVTEGKTDTEVLSAAVRPLNPAVADYFVWPDLTVRMMQGTSGVEHTLKALDWVGIQGPVVGLCDNDLEGQATVRRIQNLPLATNIRATTYPHVTTASNWPVVSPSGTTLLDVNGLACSLELYFGSDVLGTGQERPVIRMRTPGPGQGVIDGKDELKKKFMRKVQQSTPDRLVGDWQDMKELVNVLLAPVVRPAARRTPFSDLW
jgi:hypothetical protein